MMKKRIGNSFMLIGAVCVIFSAVLFYMNYNEDRKAGETADRIISELDRAQSSGDAAIDADEMPFYEVDGYEYIGSILIPSINTDLPVMKDWDYTRLKIAPCRYYGSYFKNNLVIAAHNYTSHFGRLKYLVPGDVVYFTDAENRTYSYTVVGVETFAPTAIAEMIESEYDLTLFTCNMSGAARVTVRCKMI